MIYIYNVYNMSINIFMKYYKNIVLIFVRIMNIEIEVCKLFI